MPPKRQQPLRRLMPGPQKTPHQAPHTLAKKPLPVPDSRGSVELLYTGQSWTSLWVEHKITPHTFDETQPDSPRSCVFQGDYDASEDDAKNEDLMSSFFQYKNKWYPYNTDCSPELEALAQDIWADRVQLEPELGLDTAEITPACTPEIKQEGNGVVLPQDTAKLPNVREKNGNVHDAAYGEESFQLQQSFSQNFQNIVTSIPGAVYQQPLFGFNRYHQPQQPFYPQQPSYSQQSFICTAIPIHTTTKSNAVAPVSFPSVPFVASPSPMGEKYHPAMCPYGCGVRLLSIRSYATHRPHCKGRKQLFGKKEGRDKDYVAVEWLERHAVEVHGEQAEGSDSDRYQRLSLSKGRRRVCRRA